MPVRQQETVNNLGAVLNDRVEECVFRYLTAKTRAKLSPRLYIPTLN